MADALTVSQLEELARFAYEQGDIDRARMRLAQADELKAAEAQERGELGEAAYAGGAGVTRGAAEVAQLGPTILDFMTAGLPAYLAEKVFGAEPTERVKGPTIPEQIGELTGGYSEYRSPTTLANMQEQSASLWVDPRRCRLAGLLAQWDPQCCLRSQAKPQDKSPRVRNTKAPRACWRLWVFPQCKRPQRQSYVERLLARRKRCADICPERSDLSRLTYCAAWALKTYPLANN